MYSFFVLGLIPGTSFQITFQLWLDCLMLSAEVVGVIWLYRRHKTELSPFLHASTARVVVYEFSNKTYQQAGRQFKAFLQSQLTSWQEL